MSLTKTRNKKIEKALDVEVEQELGLRSSSPINRAAVRKLVLARLEVIRPALHGKLTRVSESSLQWVESRVQNLIDAELREHATVGSTVNLGKR